MNFLSDLYEFSDVMVEFTTRKNCRQMHLAVWSDGTPSFNEEAFGPERNQT
jgi:hypothetical protein